MKSTTKNKRITLCVRVEGQWKAFSQVDEAFARRHLKAVSTALDTLDPGTTDRRVTLPGANAGFLKAVLDLLNKYGDKTEVRISKEPLARAIGFYQAVHALGVQPPQPKVEAHIVGHLAHNEVSPDDIAIVQKAFGDVGRASPIWAAMVDQVSWYFWKGHYDEEKRWRVADEVHKYAELQAAVEEKMDELEARRQFNLRDQRERRATGRKTKKEYKPPAPLANHATTQQHAPETRIQPNVLSADPIKIHDQLTMHSHQAPVTDETLPPTTFAREDISPFSLVVSNNILEFQHGLQGVEAQEGIQKVKVEVELDQEHPDLEAVRLKMLEWSKVIAEMFGKT